MLAPITLRRTALVSAVSVAVAIVSACGGGMNDAGETSASSEQALGVDSGTDTGNGVCSSNSNCSGGSTCEDYDCDGVAHCAPPHQGGASNCCNNGNLSCVSGYSCGVSGGRTYATCQPPCPNGSTPDWSALSQDGNACYGACGLGCNQCWEQDTSSPYACPDGSQGTVTKKRLICPIASCCIDHDNCTRNCPSWECQLACQSSHVACEPGLSGGSQLGGLLSIPDLRYQQFAERDIVSCGQCAPVMTTN